VLRAALFQNRWLYLVSQVVENGIGNVESLLGETRPKLVDCKLLISQHDEEILIYWGGEKVHYIADGYILLHSLRCLRNIQLG